MAKKEKPVLTPEEIAAKKLKRKKVWARIGAVACALAITGAIYAVGSKDGPKIVREEPEQVIVKQIVTQPAPAAPTTAAPTTKAPAAPTTAAPTTAAPTTAAPTTKPNNNNSSGGGGILDTITGLLGGFDIGSIGDTLGGLVGGGGGGGLIDKNSIADKVEGAGGSAKDFFYGLADSVEENDGLDGINGDVADKINDIGSGEGGGLPDGLGDIGSKIGDIFGGLGDIGGLLG